MKPFRITIHCTATQNGTALDIKEIERWHMAPPRNFSMVGYHAVIQPDGEIQYGRPLNMQGAHVKGENENNVGVALVGTDFYTKEQFDALRHFIHAMQQCYDIKTHEIWCHYQFDSAIKQGKTCPNVTIQRLLSWYVGNDYGAIDKYLTV